MKKKHILLLEIFAVGFVFLLTRELLESVKYSAQIALIISLILITVLLKKRKTSWKDLGFRKPDNWVMAILYFVLCVASIGLIFNFVIQPLFPSGVHDINQGQPISFEEMLFQVFIVAIFMAGMGEEMLMRGFLLNNLNDLLGKNIFGTTAAIFIQALVFGILHTGIQGMVSAGVMGVILGIFYIISKRNLLIVMAAHTVPDVLSIISSYLNQ